MGTKVGFEKKKMYSSPEDHLPILYEELTRVQQRNSNLLRENISLREAAVAAEKRFAAERLLDKQSIADKREMLQTCDDEMDQLRKVIRRLGGNPQAGQEE